METPYEKIPFEEETKIETSDTCRGTKYVRSKYPKSVEKEIDQDLVLIKKCY
jgi:hypothetical protein